MYMIVLLSLVISAQAGRRICGENCTIQPSDQVTSLPVPYCKCHGRRAERLKAGSKNSLYEKDAIFYEPFESNMRFQKKRPYTSYVSNMEPTIVISKRNFPIKINHNLYDNIYPKEKRESFNLEYHKGDVRTTNSPIYLDINIHEAIDNDLTLYEVYQTKMKELTETHLKDCLDLHAILYSKDKGQVSDLNYILSERNKIYNKLPNSDLVVEINKKCKQSDTIIKNSIAEIKANRPYITKFNANNIANKEFDKPSNSTQDGDSKSQETVRYHHTSFDKTSDEYLYKESNTAEYNTLKNSSKTDNNTAENNTDFFNSTYQVPNNTQQDSLSLDTTVSSYTDTNLPKITPEYEQESSTINDIEPQNNLSRTNSIEDQMDNTSETYLTDNGVTVNDTIPFYFNNTDSGSSELDRDQNQNDEIISEQKSRELLNVENATTTENALNNVSNSSDRTKYFEDEFIQEQESDRNLDFLKPLESSTLHTPDANSSESIFAAQRDENTNINNFTNLSIQSENPSNYANNITNETSFTINGNLYYKYGTEYVPASFVQKPDGKVDVTLDLLSLCKSNEEKKSKLMQAICSCIQFS